MPPLRPAPAAAIRLEARAEGARTRLADLQRKIRALPEAERMRLGRILDEAWGIELDAQALMHEKKFDEVTTLLDRLKNREDRIKKELASMRT
jgi:hypothetical protein